MADGVLPGSSEEGARAEGAVRLGGGNSTEVLRVGGTVHRATGQWTTAVHRLLRRLEAAGFEGAPRVLGRDEGGREVLTFVEGAVVHPRHLHLVASEAALAEVAALIAELHRRTATMLDLAGSWSGRAADPRGRREVICHNDLAPWNLVRTTSGWAFIDFDLAAPGGRDWDLAWALLTLVPLSADRELDDRAVASRCSSLIEGYGWPADAAERLFRLARRRALKVADEIGRGAERGDERFVRLARDGHEASWRRAAEHVEASAGRWCALVGR